MSSHAQSTFAFCKAAKATRPIRRLLLSGFPLVLTTRYLGMLFSQFNNELSGRPLNSCENRRMAMPRLLVLVTIAAFCFSGTVRAGETIFESGPDKVHLLELFTSEGCSSCPPAETQFTQLNSEGGFGREFVPVSFHVDYWNHLGWRDRFATKEWTSRQQIYAARWRAGSVYTPGFVLDGHESQAQLPRGSKEMAGKLLLKTSGDDAQVSFKPAQNEVHAREVYLASLGFALTAAVAAGGKKGSKNLHV